MENMQLDLEENSRLLSDPSVRQGTESNEKLGPINSITPRSKNLSAGSQSVGMRDSQEEDRWHRVVQKRRQI